MDQKRRGSWAHMFTIQSLCRNILSDSCQALGPREEKNQCLSELCCPIWWTHIQMKLNWKKKKSQILGHHGIMGKLDSLDEPRLCTCASRDAAAQGSRPQNLFLSGPHAGTPHPPKARCRCAPTHSCHQEDCAFGCLPPKQCPTEFQPTKHSI